MPTAIQEEISVRGSRKAGQTPITRPSRQQLLFEFDLQRQSQDPGSRGQQYFLCGPYPPSAKSVSELNPICISELKRGIHHRGKVLFIRTIDSAIRVAAVHSIVQDEAGVAEKLAIYNTDVAVSAEDCLPEDAIFAIKEPYYAAAANKTFSLRVDHPSDLIRLGPSDEKIPRALSDDLPKENKSPIDWKQEGNVAYSSERYLAAVEAYSQGLDACSSDNITIRQDLLRNRAIVNILLKRFEQALADARAAIISIEEGEDEGTIALNSKAYERAGRAAYGLGRLDEAKACFKKTQELSPSNKEAVSALQRIEKRQRERSNGEYDFSAMSRSASKKHNRLDHADFTSNTTIRQTDTRGNGLFATKDITFGQLIMCEKATCVAFDSDPSSHTYTILNQNNKRALTGTQATLLFTLIQTLLHNPSVASSFFTLYDNNYTPKTPTQPLDNLVPIDAFRTLSIIEYNSFECPTPRSSSKAAQKQASTATGHHSTGLWLHASYINHACDGNAMRSFIGDMMIIRATKDIRKDEEILMPYRLPNAINSITQEELQKTWGFKCDCRICKAEAATPLSQRKYRAQLIEKSRSLCSVSPSQPRKPNITHLQTLISKLRSTYSYSSPHSHFLNTPRLGLIHPQLYLCQVYKSLNKYDKVIETALSLLRDLGLGVEIKGKEVEIERQHCQMEGTAIEAAMLMAEGFRRREEGLGGEMEEFARGVWGVWGVVNGEGRGWEERFGKGGV